jgi:hypothetical protein
MAHADVNARCPLPGRASQIAAIIHDRAGEMSRTEAARRVRSFGGV